MQEEDNLVVEDSQQQSQPEVHQKEDVQEQVADPSNQQVIPKLAMGEKGQANTKFFNKLPLDSDRQKSKSKDPSSDPSRIMRTLQRCSSISDDKSKSVVAGKNRKATPGYKHIKIME